MLLWKNKLIFCLSQIHLIQRSRNNHRSITATSSLATFNESDSLGPGGGGPAWWCFSCFCALLWFQVQSSSFRPDLCVIVSEPLEMLSSTQNCCTLDLSSFALQTPSVASGDLTDGRHLHSFVSPWGDREFWFHLWLYGNLVHVWHCRPPSFLPHYLARIWIW